MTSTRDKRRRSGVFRLNAGSSPFGQRSSLPLNIPGGSFMSGRTAGGSPAGAATIAQALAQGRPAPSAQGPVVEHGPPPVIPTPAPTPAPGDDRPLVPHLPSFTPPQQTSLASQVTSLFPSFTPIVQALDPRKVRYF